jgi:hypothetical protein
MPDPKKPSTIDQIVELLKTMVTEPITDQSSRPPTPADVKNVRAAMATPRKRKAAAKPKAKAKPAAKKKAKTASRKKSAPRTKKKARK